jgi:hypothetical protein
MCASAAFQLFHTATVGIQLVISDVSIEAFFPTANRALSL